MTIFLLNTTILTTPGLTYTSRYVGLVEAKSTLGINPLPSDWKADSAAGLTSVHVVSPRPEPVISAIGHQATAELASSLLGLDVPMSRTPARMVPGDLAICVRLRERAPEGVILSRAEVEAIGYDLVRLDAIDPDQLWMARRNMEIVAELLAFPDDTTGLPAPLTTEQLAADTVALALGVQRPGTRRKGMFMAMTHYVVRRLEHDGGGYVEVIQEHGTEAWSVNELTEAQAAARYA